jgi:phosphatidylserine/phosphatidylglycerophosphate/cardiolipin synthase-like enzyme
MEAKTRADIRRCEWVRVWLLRSGLAVPSPSPICSITNMYVRTPMTEPTILFLMDGGQPATTATDTIVAFIESAHRTLDLAIYDAHFGGSPDDTTDPGNRILSALTTAEARGITVRAVFNDDDGPRGPYPFTQPPPSGPNFLARLTNAVPTRGVDGRFDLMHHKYIVRDAGDPTNAGVLTGSTNWTNDSFTRMENAILTVPSRGLANSYTRDFDQLWRHGDVEGTGRFDNDWSELIYDGAPFRVRAFFSPGRGRSMSHQIARRVAEAKVRVRISSPVITSTPILGTVAEAVSDGRIDISVVTDGTQMRQVVSQWRNDGRGEWKIPLYRLLQNSGVLAEKRSTPYAPEALHDYMHAKMIVADDWVLTGSFNASHSGEQNAENIVEIESAAFAAQCAAFIDSVHAQYFRPLPGNAPPPVRPDSFGPPPRHAEPHEAEVPRGSSAPAAPSREPGGVPAKPRRSGAI